MHRWMDGSIAPVPRLELLRGGPDCRLTFIHSCRSNFFHRLLSPTVAWQVVMAIEEEFALEIPDNEADKILSIDDAVKYITAHPQAK